MRMTMRPWMKALALVVFINAIFLLLALWAARLPREPLVERIREAFASGELIGSDYLWFDSRRGSGQYNDCFILKMISTRDENVWAGALGPLSYDKNAQWFDQCRVLRSLVNEGPNASPYLVSRYTRY